MKGAGARAPPRPARTAPQWVTAPGPAPAWALLTQHPYNGLELVGAQGGHWGLQDRG